MTAPVRLYVSYDSGLDWLMAYEFGRVDDGQPADHWAGVGDSFGFLHDAPGGRIIGFKVTNLSAFDPEALDVATIWEGSRFDAPMLGLLNASAGEVVLAARSHFDGRSSLNRELFSLATGLSGETAVEAWRRCLEAGDAMAHFALGYTLLELGRAPEAYRHLRHYTEIAPAGAWNWCWYGQAAEAVGEISEARRAYRRAIELTEGGEQETDAPERLAALPAPETYGAVQASPAGAGDRVVLWGDELPQLGHRRVQGLSPRIAAGLTAGARKKSYAHTDPNEDAVAVVQTHDRTLIVCADGHNGMTSTRAAVEAVLERLGEPPDPARVDEQMVDLWLAANKRVIAAGAAAGQPQSRTTLVVAILAEGLVRWAAMGDSLLALVRGDDVVFLSQPKSHFVGWPMTREEIAQRLPRGTLQIESDAWVIAATDGLTDFVSGLQQALRAAVEDDVGASRVVERLIDYACAGGAGDNVAVAAALARGGRLADVAAARPHPEMRIRGCLFGGAVGDALGAPIEFDAIGRIRKRLGPRGITDYQPAYGRRGAITDDTQMSLFTAEGLIRAYVRGTLKGLCHPASVVDHAYARWLATQGETSSRWDSAEFDGWLIGNRGLHHTRAPGNTCLSALRAGRMGTIEEPLNDSKGCGGVMRAAPVGLLGRDFPGDRFDLGCEIAALTHGHPSGYLTAGALAEIISALAWTDATLDDALDRATTRLRAAPRHEEALDALQAARTLAASGAEPSPETIATLGEGWVAEEALAIGVYCALMARDFEQGVLLAVNHSGDSDSTGAITGNILGAIHGYNEIPAQWIYDLEMRDVIEMLCRDWNMLFARDEAVDLEREETWWDRYPGW